MMAANYFKIFKNAAVNLKYMLMAVLSHKDSAFFASNAACAIADDGFILKLAHVL